jgi:hypothetical protein
MRHPALRLKSSELDILPRCAREVRHGCSGGVAPAKDLERDAATGQQIGSNHDPTGNNTQGFASLWCFAELGRRPRIWRGRMSMGCNWRRWRNADDQPRPIALQTSPSAAVAGQLTRRGHTRIDIAAGC